jgi:hypothetical protein
VLDNVSWQQLSGDGTGRHHISQHHPARQARLGLKPLRQRDRRALHPGR